MLPAAPVSWQLHDVKDNTGFATTSPITVFASGSNIDGNSSILINGNWDSVTFLFNGTRWNII